MRLPLRFLAAVSLIFVLRLPGAGQDSPSPSLGDLARQVQQDREKNKAGNSATKTVTNDDLSLQEGSSNTAGDVVSMPDKTWGVQMDSPGLTVTSNGAKPDGRRYLLEKNNSTGVVVSVTLEEVARGKSAMDCNAIMQSRVADTPQNRAMEDATGIEKKDVKTWQEGDKAFMEYLVPTVTGPGGALAPINQQNRFLCFMHDGVFVDVHVSKADFHPGDAKLIDAVYASLQIREGPAATESSLEYFRAGSARFIVHDFQGAIPLYAQALALEQKQRTLEKNYWYVLVDNLGMAYGITGDLEAARRTFEYGIRIDPGYPLFYYEMADCYGEKHDAQNAIVFLKKAYERKANLIAGETMPDPRGDDSFKSLMNDNGFRDFLDTVLKGS